ncbi:MAG: hypothetical protein NUW37_14940 [Planctomycetes bacterium]|nr:hypothetical protein [Planctomycetota bacterium]
MDKLRSQSVWILTALFVVITGALYYFYVLSQSSALGEVLSRIEQQKTNIETKRSQQMLPNPVGTEEMVKRKAELTGILRSKIEQIVEGDKAALDSFFDGNSALRTNVGEWNAAKTARYNTLGELAGPIVKQPDPQGNRPGQREDPIARLENVTPGTIVAEDQKKIELQQKVFWIQNEILITLLETANQAYKDGYQRAEGVFPVELKRLGLPASKPFLDTNGYYRHIIAPVEFNVWSEYLGYFLTRMLDPSSEAAEVGPQGANIRHRELVRHRPIRFGISSIQLKHNHYSEDGDLGALTVEQIATILGGSTPTLDSMGNPILDFSQRETILRSLLKDGTSGAHPSVNVRIDFDVRDILSIDEIAQTRFFFCSIPGSFGVPAGTPEDNYSEWISAGTNSYLYKIAANVNGNGAVPGNFRAVSPYSGYQVSAPDQGSLTTVLSLDEAPAPLVPAIANRVPLAIRCPLTGYEYTLMEVHQPSKIKPQVPGNFMLATLSSPPTIPALDQYNLLPPGAGDLVKSGRELDEYPKSQ